MATAQIPASIIAARCAAPRSTTPPTQCGARGIFKVKEYTPDGRTLEASACAALGHVELVRRSLREGTILVFVETKTTSSAHIGR